MKNIFIDESGYTGADLLNTDQPFQAAASVKINEDEAEKLVNEFFPRRQSLELKHKKLSKRKSNWKPLLEIQKILLNEFMGFSYICDKKFLLGKEKGVGLQEHLDIIDKTFRICVK